MLTGKLTTTPEVYNKDDKPSKANGPGGRLYYGLRAVRVNLHSADTLAPPSTLPENKQYVFTLTIVHPVIDIPFKETYETPSKW
ncbi:hypothetical protein CEP53_000616 [Fusarium sp. AF-6]|nr:hypothetical protein CEP53_000616 [Fusarium sp. AF-6]